MKKENEKAAPNVEPKKGFGGKPKPKKKRESVNRPEKVRRPQPEEPNRNRSDKEGCGRETVEKAVRSILTPYVTAVGRLYDCSCREKLKLELAVETELKDDIATVKAALLTSRDDADSKKFKDGVVTERKWHNVYRLERRYTDGERIDVGKFCTTFIEWCTFLFTDRKALVRELNVGKQRKFLWWRL